MACRFRAAKPTPDVGFSAQRLDLDVELDHLDDQAVLPFHFAGTARMGTDDLAVVDPITMRVRGVDGLRVVDASVLPGEVTANIHPAVIGVAERAADLIKASR